MLKGWAKAMVCALWLGGFGATANAQPKSGDAKCERLFVRAAALLAEEAYERMLHAAEEHLRSCPGPRSAMLIGLAEANRVDAQLIVDPPQRERARKRALHHLRVAATQGELLPSEWLLSIGEWIVSLQQRGPVATLDVVAVPALSLGESRAVEVEGLQVVEPVQVPRAPPPRAQPQFPWGPVAALGVGGVALTTSLVLAIGANDRFGDVQLASEELRIHQAELSKDDLERRQAVLHDRRTAARSYERWATLFAMGGGAALVTGAVWYWLVPPEGNWRWAVAPTGASLRARF